MTAELVAQIAADPDDENLYLVYADWLQAQGDPLGELIIFESRVAKGEDVNRERWAYLEKHRAYLLGAMAHRLDLFWRLPRKLGFLRTLPIEDLEGWLTAPVARFATTIFAQGDDAIRALEASPARPPLRALAVQPSSDDLLDLSWIWPRFPRLEIFELDGNARIDSISLPRAREVWLGFAIQRLDTAAVAAVNAAAWPALESLSIAYVGEREIEPLLDGKRAPKLRRLAIDRFADEPDAIATLLASAPIVPQLRHLALTGWKKLEGPGARALAAAAERFRHLEIFDVSLGRRIPNRERAVLKAVVKPDQRPSTERGFAPWLPVA